MPHRLIGQKVLVVGPGWLGQQVASDIVGEGASVFTLRRTAAPTPSALPRSLVALAGDIRAVDRDSPLPDWTSGLPSSIDHVVLAIAPGRNALDDYASVYPPAVSGALALAERLGARSVLYVSSTGVYGQRDGRWVTEADALVAHDARQRALILAESRLHDDSDLLGRTILRPAGLYGPGRDPASRFARDVPIGDADGWTNFSWRDDVVEAIVAALARPIDRGRCAVFNCTDGTPLRRSNIARALGATQLSAASGSATSNQRVSSDRLRETGWQPSMRTVLHGLASLGHAVNFDAIAPTASHD